MKKIIYKKKALKFLQKLSQVDQKRILNAIVNLPNGDVKKLVNNGTLKRLRVGNFRIIYDDDGVIYTIFDINNRGDVYKKY